MGDGAGDDMAFTRDQLELLMGYAKRLDAAGHGERGAIADEACRLHGWSANAFYARLKAVGWQSGRKARADKGTTGQCVKALEFVAALETTSLRKNGKQTRFTPVNTSIAVANGHDISVSASQIRRLMRARRLDVKSQREAQAPVELRSLHPNHVHAIDPSLCLVYYLRGRQFVIRDDQFYKNKLDRVAEIRLKVWRYVLADHASGVLVPWYVEAKGESPENLFSALVHAWSKRDGRRFHGASQILLMDKGSANTAKAIANLCAALETRIVTHEAGNARAKGGVENGNNLVETQFESRLQLQPVSDVAELNERSATWAEAYNANAIPGQDTRLRRPGLAEPMARYDLWLRIANEQLRLLPDEDVLRQFLEGRAETRTVSKTLQINYRHPRADRPRVYDVSNIAGICVGDKLALTPLIYGECAIHLRVPAYDGEDRIHRIEPMADTYDDFGRHTDSPVIGEQYARRADTDADRAGKRLDAVAYPQMTVEEVKKARARNATPFGGEVNALDYLDGAEVPPAILRRGTPIAVSSRIVEAEPLSLLETCKRLRALGVTRDDLYAVVKRDHPDGVLEDRLAEVAAALRSAPVLRAVGE